MKASILHENPWFSVTHKEDPNTLNGQGWYRVKRPDCVMVIPVLSNGKIVMIKGKRDTTGNE